MSFPGTLLLVALATACLPVLGDDRLLDSETQRQLAVAANQRVWALLQQETLSEMERDEVLYAAFASSYHWRQTGTGVNLQRGEWLISRVYVRLGLGHSALHHAQRCLALTEAHRGDMKDFDIAYAYEGMSRSYAVTGEVDAAREYYEKALAAADEISDEEDKALFMSDLNSGFWNGFRY